MTLWVSPLQCRFKGPLARYVKVWVVHAPEMPGMFCPPPRVSDPDIHHGMCATHVPICMSRSLTSGFLWSRGRGKRSRHSRRMRNPKCYVSGKRPMHIRSIPGACATLNFTYLVRGPCAYGTVCCRPPACRWFSAQLQFLKCVSHWDTAVVH